jgi:hypothetical protein
MLHPPSLAFAGKSAASDEGNDLTSAGSARKAPLRWYRSVAVKCCLVAFVATHIPLLGLIAFVVLLPELLSPLGVLFAALIFTLLATAVVLSLLWRMFRPLRAAADGLQGFMAHGRPFSSDVGSSDEIGRLVQVLVRALGHLDRGRAPLFHAGAFMMSEKTEHAAPSGDSDKRWMALLEIDQWETLDGAGNVEEMLEIQSAVGQSLRSVLQPGEVMMPWGRGRFLAVLAASGADAFDRLQGLCSNLPRSASGARYTMTVALEPKQKRPARWPSALQRLDHKLFAMRMEGRTAQVA